MAGTTRRHLWHLEPRCSDVRLRRAAITYYEGIFDKAANFGGRITKEHAFNDGNKRTGYGCIELYLRRNGYHLSFAFDEAYEVIKRLALGTGIEGEMTYVELAEWLEANSVRATRD